MTLIPAQQSALLKLGRCSSLRIWQHATKYFLREHMLSPDVPLCTNHKLPERTISSLVRALQQHISTFVEQPAAGACGPDVVLLGCCPHLHDTKARDAVTSLPEACTDARARCRLSLSACPHMLSVQETHGHGVLPTLVLSTTTWGQPSDPCVVVVRRDISMPTQLLARSRAVQSA